MEIIKDRKQDGWIDVHFDSSDEVYFMVAHGTAEHGHYGSRYMSLAPELAVDLAKKILAKFKDKK